MLETGAGAERLATRWGIDADGIMLIAQKFGDERFDAGLGLVAVRPDGFDALSFSRVVGIQPIGGGGTFSVRFAGAEGIRILCAAC